MAVMAHFRFDIAAIRPRSRLLTAGLLALVAVVAMPGAASAQDRKADARKADARKGDAADGREFAQTWCTECHAIDAKAAPGGKAGPAFAAIANRRSVTSRRLIRWLYSKHKNMPDFEVELDDASDVAAYIMSLRRR
jgi:mono/diheme cytochrome c family protein